MKYHHFLFLLFVLAELSIELTFEKKIAFSIVYAVLRASSYSVLNASGLCAVRRTEASYKMYENDV